MNLKQLRYFIAIADSGSMSAAAGKVRIAQSAISSQIALLEEELGTKLLLRHSRGAHFTAAGRVFIEHARKILEGFETAKVAVRETSTRKSGKVEIGLPSGISTHLAMPFIDFMAEDMTDVEVRILEGLNADVKGWLDSNEVDIAVLYQTDRHIPKGAVPLVEDELVLAGPPLPHADDGEPRDFASLADIPLACTARAHGVRAVVDGVARKMGVALHYSAEIDSTYQLKTLVLRGKCHSALPRSVFERSETLSPSVTIYPLRQPAMTIRTYLLANPRRSSTLNSEVARALKKFVDHRVASGHWPGGKTFRF